MFYHFDEQAVKLMARRSVAIPQFQNRAILPQEDINERWVDFTITIPQGERDRFIRR